MSLRILAHLVLIVPLFLVLVGPVLVAQAATITLTSPSPSATLSGVVTLTATTSVAAHDVTFVVSESFTNPPQAWTPQASSSGAMTLWTATWDSRLAPNGTYTLQAQADGGIGARYDSQTISVTVNNVKSVTLTSPASGATVSGIVNLSATTSVAAQNLSFVASESFTNPPQAWTPQASSSGSMTLWTATWDSRLAPNGTYTLQAQADAGINRYDSQIISVTVNNVPTVLLTSPASGAALSGVVTLTATTSVAAHDVTFVASESFTNPPQAWTPSAGSDGSKTLWTATWDSRLAPNGMYTLQAQADGGIGARYDSTTISVTVDNYSPQTETAAASSINTDKNIPPALGSTLCASGSRIKASGAAIYYCGADGKRYVFTNEGVYFSWYSDFSSITVLSDATLSNIPLGGNVTYRPGIRMIKIQTDPKVYAVAKGGTLRWVTSEAVASRLYGANWNTKIHDVSDAFFVNYSMGQPIY